jgi:hypothetical protein
MDFQFTKHYTRDEARALLPRVRDWLKRVRELHRVLEHLDDELKQRLKHGRDLGGEIVNRWVRTLAAIRDVVQEFRVREIQIKDLDRGLVDFPAILSGREVFLCWEQDEEDIEFWHDLDAGFAGRTRI